MTECIKSRVNGDLCNGLFFPSPDGSRYRRSLITLTRKRASRGPTPRPYFSNVGGLFSVIQYPTGHTLSYSQRPEDPASHYNGRSRPVRHVNCQEVLLAVFIERRSPRHRPGLSSLDVGPGELFSRTVETSYTQSYCKETKVY